MNGTENSAKGRDDNTERVIKALAGVLQHAEDAQDLAEFVDAKCSSSNSNRANRRKLTLKAKKDVKKFHKAEQRKKKEAGEEEEEAADEHIDHEELAALTAGFKPHGLLHYEDGSVHAYRLQKTASANGINHFNERTSYAWPSFGTGVTVVKISAHDSYVYMLLHNDSTDEDEHCIFKKQEPILRIKSNDSIFYGFVGGDLAIFLRRYNKNSIRDKLAAALDQKLSLVIPSDDICSLASFAASAATTKPPIDAIDRIISVYALSGERMLQVGAEVSDEGEHTRPTGSLYFRVPGDGTPDPLCQSHVICINQAVSSTSIVDETIFYVFPDVLAVSHFGRTLSISTKVASDKAAHIQRSSLGVVVFTTPKSAKYASVYQMVTYPGDEGEWHTAVLSRTFCLYKNTADALVLEEVKQYALNIEISGGRVKQQADVAFCIATHQTDDADQAKAAHDTILAQTQSRFSGYHAAIVHPCQDSKSLGLIAVMPRINNSSNLQSVANFIIQVEAITQDCGLELGNIFSNGDPQTTLALAYCMKKPFASGEATSGYFDIHQRSGQAPNLRLEWTATPDACISHFVTTSSSPLDNFNCRDVFYGQSVTTKLVDVCYQIEQSAKEANSRQSFEDDLKKLRGLYATAIKEKKDFDDRLKVARDANHDLLKKIADLTTQQLMWEEDKKAAQATSIEKKALKATQSHVVAQEATIADLEKKKTALQAKVGKMEAEMQQLKQTTAAGAAKNEQYIQELQKELGKRAEEAKQTQHAAERQVTDIKNIKQQLADQTREVGRVKAERDDLKVKLAKTSSDLTAQSKELDHYREATTKATSDVAQIEEKLTQELDKLRQDQKDCRKAAAIELEEAKQTAADLTLKLQQQQETEELGKKLHAAFVESEKAKLLAQHKLELEQIRAAAVPPSPVVTDEREQSVVSPSLSDSRMSMTSNGQDIETYRADVARYREDALQYREEIQELRSQIKALQVAEKSLKDEMENRGRIIGALRSQLESFGGSQLQLTELQQMYASLQQQFYQLQSTYEETAINYQQCYDELFALKQQQHFRGPRFTQQQQLQPGTRQLGPQSHSRRPEGASAALPAPAAPSAPAPTAQTTQQPPALPVADPNAPAE